MSESICTETGKTQYSSSAAKRALGRAREHGGPQLRKSYRSKFCGLYHLTSKSEPRAGRPSQRLRR